jgi:glyoxylase-like metal-dependent hydrolase (beta-lactamase superfamily II)
MLKRLSDRVHYMNYDDSKARPSLGLVIGDKASLMIDAGNSKDHASEYLKEMKSLNVENLKYLGITHFHWDHVYGIPYLDLISISSEATQTRLNKISESAKSGANVDRIEKNTLNAIKKLSEDTDFESIDIGFDKRLRLDLGGVSCIFEHIGGDHAADSSLIYIEKEKVMFLGDSTYRGFYGDKRYHTAENVKRIAREILKYDCELFLTSHKEVYTRDEMESTLGKMIEMGEMASRVSDIREIDAIKNLDEEETFYLQAFMEYKYL